MAHRAEQSHVRDRIQLKALVIAAIVVLATGLDIHIPTNTAFYAAGVYVIATGDISETDSATLGAGAMSRV